MVVPAGTQAQVRNLQRDLQRELGVGYLLIIHHIAVVEYMADPVAVMKLGGLMA